jgi:signal transduction histidine kinase
VDDAYRAVTQALQQYVPLVDSADERQRVARLQQEVQELQQSMLDVLATESSKWPASARAILSAKVVPKRQTVIRIYDEAQSINRNTFVRKQEELRDAYAASQQALWWSLGLALVASTALTLLGAMYAGRLERRVTRQSVDDARNAAELHRLSAKIISAQEEERRTIARELHDEIGQALTAIKVELSVAQRAVESGQITKSTLDDARSISEGALTTVRNLSHAVHPALLDDMGLPATVDWYLRGFGRRYSIRTDLLQDAGVERLAPEVEASAYRIIQEGLTNVAKHAQASECRVHLRRLADRLFVTIEDDGVGFDTLTAGTAPDRKGLGLIGIRERASHLAGSVRVESTFGKGTRLTVDLPARPRLAFDG